MKMTAAKKQLGIITVCLMVMLAFGAQAQAATKKVSLSTLLKSSGITFKLERLDRADGFLFGLTFKGKKTPLITIAPGLNRMLLVQVDGADIILQGNGAGKMEVIQADGDIGTALCVLDAIIDFLTGLQTCQSDPVCLFTQIFSLITGITSCDGETTTESFFPY